ncbi:hypothetical protein QR680_007522 [Steinernema hermaphroditum]|uniref:Uncharacterized protein n=1 Tax=Steinernema hermaphroditum TaxID=289476 RepID=A0AA39M6I9_9BILA|nr:hypothetical protein QR680_007522 [Steinernema hermaphroditum]
MGSEALRQEEEEVFRRFKRGSSSGRHVTSEAEETDRLLLEGPLPSPIEESDARETEDEEQDTAAFFIEEREKEANDYRRLSNGEFLLIYEAQGMHLPVEQGYPLVSSGLVHVPQQEMQSMLSEVRSPTKPWPVQLILERLNVTTRGPNDELRRKMA